MADSIRVNGSTKSWGSIKFRLVGELWVGFHSISFSDKRERVKQYGMGRHHAPRGQSAGKYGADNVKVSGDIDSVQLLREGLAAQASDGISYGNVIFAGLVQYIEPDGKEITVELDRLTWAMNSMSNEESPDPLKEDFELGCMLIRRNGLTLFDASEGMP